MCFLSYFIGILQLSCMKCSTYCFHCHGDVYHYCSMLYVVLWDQWRTILAVMVMSWHVFSAGHGWPPGEGCSHRYLIISGGVQSLHGARVCHARASAGRWCKCELHLPQVSEPVPVEPLPLVLGTRARGSTCQHLKPVVKPEGCQVQTWNEGHLEHFHSEIPESSWRKMTAILGWDEHSIYFGRKKNMHISKICTCKEILLSQNTDI